jgi:plasmid replication initiation protein
MFQNCPNKQTKVMKMTDSKVLQDNSQYVVKSNRLIEASYRLSLREQQIILFAIVQARETETGISPDEPCQISVKEFAKTYGLSSTALYTELKNAIATLFERSVTTYSNSSGKKIVSKTRWIYKTTYEDEPGYEPGHLTLTFTPDVIKYITRLENEFTRYDLAQVGNLNSFYAVRLYELLKQHQAIKSRELTVEWLKEHFQITKGYDAFADLKKRIIDSSIDQINEHTDLRIKYEILKKGRKAVAFKFLINTKSIPKPRQATLSVKTPQPGEIEFTKKQLAAASSSSAHKPYIPNEVKPADPAIAKAAIAALKKKMSIT